MGPFLSILLKIILILLVSKTLYFAKNIKILHKEDEFSTVKTGCRLCLDVLFHY
jgi:hypothetical protein